MKCKHKRCKQVVTIKGAGDNYICSGINKKPTKYKNDNVWLCLNGEYVKDLKLEMTMDEAFAFMSTLTATLSVMFEEKDEKIRPISKKDVPRRKKKTTRKRSRFNK